MAYPKIIKELGEPWKSIYSIKDPMHFIDMLAAQSYFCGHFQNQVPIAESRVVFLTWLEAYMSVKSPAKGDK